MPSVFSPFIGPFSVGYGAEKGSIMSCLTDRLLKVACASSGRDAK